MMIRAGLDLASAALGFAAALALRIWMRLRKPLVITVGAVILVMLLIALLQSGLGVDSEVTIKDSERPEIVGD